MTITIRELHAGELEDVIPLLLLAEPSEPALRWGLANLSDALYRMDDDGQLVGAASVQWRSAPCEIEELAIAPERQGQGLGRQLIAWLGNEARRRGYGQMVVGTGNSSLANIAFYQKCGGRMDHIRPNYFRYYGQPVYENGIQKIDLLVFRFDLGDVRAISPQGRRGSRG
ncbi:MAG: GNAT family N-acetyltransferase [Chloroflexales bacterium]|nr:GNAT family N-acetyltransferase [Chloroflexales bacterium]